jgi:hypothetical protein
MVKNSLAARPESRFRALVARTCFVAGSALLTGCARPAPKPPTQYQSLYHFPLLSPGTQFGALPPAVQRTVRAEAGGAQIADVQKTRAGERVVYVISFERGQLLPPLYVAPDGSVLTPDLQVVIPAPSGSVATLTGGPVTGLTLSDLPSKVVESIQELAPDAEVDYISTEGHGDQLTYVVTFKDRKHAPLYIAPSGQVLRGKPPK